MRAIQWTLTSAFMLVLKWLVVKATMLLETVSYKIHIMPGQARAFKS